MTSTRDTIIYTTLVFSGVVISTLFSFLLTYSPFAFIALLTLYLVGFSVYIFVFLILYRKKFNDENKEKPIQYQVATYTSVFNMLFALCMFLVAIILRKRIYKSICYTNSTTSYRY